jgi:hypothetical protein
VLSGIFQAMLCFSHPFTSEWEAVIAAAHSLFSMVSFHTNVKNKNVD